MSAISKLMRELKIAAAFFAYLAKSVFTRFDNFFHTLKQFREGFIYISRYLYIKTWSA